MLVLYNLFCAHDLDGNGHISREELENVFRELVKGKRIPKAFMDERMAEVRRHALHMTRRKQLLLGTSFYLVALLRAKPKT